MNAVRRRRSSSANASVTIREVAAAAGVSTATVSRVLSDLEGVGPAARDRVLQTARKLDYHPNRLARGLRAGRRKVIGVIIPDLHNPFFTGVIQGVEEVLYGVGFTLVLGHSDGRSDREQTHLAVLRGEGASGVILIPASEDGACYDSLRAWKIPVVAVDRAPRGLRLDFVASNSRKGIRLAVEHLISHGYRNIALLNGPESLRVTRERLAGYREALRNARVPVRDSFIFNGDFREAGGRVGISLFLDMPKPPRAVIIANNLMTLGALQVLHDRGVSIPGETAIVCFDDMPWATSLWPPLTAVAQPAEELGRTAAQLLLDRLSNPHRLPREVILPTRLIVRASCGCQTPIHPDSPRMSKTRDSENPRAKTKP